MINPLTPNPKYVVNITRHVCMHTYLHIYIHADIQENGTRS